MRRTLVVLLVIWTWTALSAAQVQIWIGGDLPLWQVATEIAPAKPRPWINLGRAYSQRGQSEMATACWQRAMTLSDYRPSRERGTARRIAFENLNRQRLDVTAWLNAN